MLSITGCNPAPPVDTLDDAMSDTMPPLVNRGIWRALSAAMKLRP
ncbi:hypothetical protein [Thiobacillus sp.]